MGLKEAAVKSKRPTTPVWEGPAGEGPNGGVTQSLIGRYLGCKERFRLMTIEGWKPADKFEPRIEYGNLWHAAEEALAGRNDPAAAVEAYGMSLLKRYPMQQQDIEHWYKMCQAFFQLYVKYWKHHDDVKQRKSLLQEEKFDVPYLLPSGRTVRLRGKWDAVDIIGKGKDAGVYIQEDKTKSQVDALKIGRQVSFDLQSLFYVVALMDNLDQRNRVGNKEIPFFPSDVRGVRYNVIRRPAHKGGKKQTAVESALEKYHEDEKNDRLGEWFGRWKIEITPKDVEKFKIECLHPVLENLLDDYEWWEFCFGEKKRACPTSPFDPISRMHTFPGHLAQHFRYPFGIWNPTAEGATADLDALLESGSTAGLSRVTNLFPELQS